MLGSRRLRALILTLVFVVGTFGISDLDAWLYHGRNADRGTTQPHYEPAGTTCGHADRCVLGVTFPNPRVVTPISVVGRLSRIFRVGSVLLALSKPHDTGRATLPRPRAPPSLPA